MWDYKSRRSWILKWGLPFRFLTPLTMENRSCPPSLSHCMRVCYRGVFSLLYRIHLWVGLPPPPPPTPNPLPSPLLGWRAFLWRVVALPLTGRDCVVFHSWIFKDRCWVYCGGEFNYSLLGDNDSSSVVVVVVVVVWVLMGGGGCLNSENETWQLTREQYWFLITLSSKYVDGINKTSISYSSQLQWSMLMSRLYVVEIWWLSFIHQNVETANYCQ